MAEHNETGKRGEALAVEYFSGKGYRILHRNWRRGHLELDLIATRKGILHFIEVKTKTANFGGFPEEEVTAKKFKYLTEAAEAYLYQFPQWQRIQFDILAITLRPQLSFFLLEDVYI